MKEDNLEFGLMERERQGKGTEREKDGGSNFFDHFSLQSLTGFAILFYG